MAAGTGQVGPSASIDRLERTTEISSIEKGEGGVITKDRDRGDQTNGGGNGKRKMNNEIKDTPFLGVDKFPHRDGEAERAGRGTSS